MTTTEHDLEKHDDWAQAAAALVAHMAPEQQRSFLVRVFRAVAHFDLTHDPEVAVRLCRDMQSTIDLQDDASYLKAAGSITATRGPTTSIKDAIARLEAM